MSSEASSIHVEAETRRAFWKRRRMPKPIDRSNLSAAEAREQMGGEQQGLERSAAGSGRGPGLCHRRPCRSDPGAAGFGRIMSRPRWRPSSISTGGGFVLGSLDTHQPDDASAGDRKPGGADRRRLPPGAPSIPFRRAARRLSCRGALACDRKRRTWIVDPDRLVLAGDSAGANLALACLLRLRDAGEPLPEGAALFYGCTGRGSERSRTGNSAAAPIG